MYKHTTTHFTQRPDTNHTHVDIIRVSRNALPTLLRFCETIEGVIVKVNNVRLKEEKKREQDHSKLLVDV